jgi:beta-lactamase class A
MIVKSDNPCGETMLAKIGYKALTNELKAIGLTKSSFINSVPETSAGDLTTFVGSLQSGQLLSPSNTATLLPAMKRNVYRQGIPAGANGQTANKVGFLDKFLHDAAIVYSPSGTYALSIMTEGSSWGVIAELTREIEKLRAQG